jgi:ribulose-5-phosphate 4-epimerase/fuculose-1-phosphate aldolase
LYLSRLNSPFAERGAPSKELHAIVINFHPGASMNSECAIQDRVSVEEWRLRVDLAAAYRLVALYGWSDLIFTHLSARVPGPDHHFLINPYGMMFDEITASNLVKVDMDCNKVLDSPHPVNPAGFTIHSAIHASREDVTCIMHTHTQSGVAVSAQKDGLLAISQQSTFVLGSLAYHDYEGVAVRADEKVRIQADLGDANHLILRNHGLLTCGTSVANAFLSLYALESACRIQLAAQSAGAALVYVAPSIIDGLGEAAQILLKEGGNFIWPALLRKLDRLDPSYKQ